LQHKKEKTDTIYPVIFYMLQEILYYDENILHDIETHQFGTWFF